MQKNHVENVVLLTMSTLTRTTMNCYKIEEADIKYYFNGISQLEAGTKYFLNLLAREGKKINRIVIIVSEQADEVIKKEENKYKGKFSACAFYQQRIIDYINNEDTIDVSEEKEGLKKWVTGKNVNWKEEFYECPFEKSDLYTDRDIKTLFWKVKDKDENGDFNLSEIIDAIKGEEGNPIDLYMDMQGGDRNAASEMNAIVKLLDSQEVKVKKRMAIQYEEDNPINEMKEVSDKYRPYELITAMRIFQQYGWGDDLKKYFEDEKSFENEVKELMEAITKASDFIKLCKINEFDQAINKVSQYYNKLNSKANKKNTLLNVILHDINEEYGDLLVVDENERMKNRPLHYVKQIKWCLRKHFIQQALTITESKMPSEYVHCGLVYYYDRDMCESVDDMLRKFEEIYKKLKKSDKYKMIDINHFLIKDMLDKKNLIEKEEFQIKNIYKTNQEIEVHTVFCLEKFGDNINENVKQYYKISNMRNKVAHASEHGKGFFSYIQKQYPKDDAFKNKQYGDIEKEIRAYLYGFECLYAKADKEKVKRIVDLA